MRMEVESQHRVNEQIIIFISFCLTDTETHYETMDQEALAMVRCLAKV